MDLEREHPILSSQGLDNEIRRLCNTENFLEALIDGVPMGSCEWLSAKAQLKGVKGRLTELGINNIEEGNEGTNR